MSKPVQRTLKDLITVEGIGVHSGAPARLTLQPARPDSGICFVRTDLPGAPKILAHFSHVVNTQMATTLGVYGPLGPGSAGSATKPIATISTVEHCLAALMGSGIDNAIIDVSGPEVPIMDGSSLPFYEAIQTAGTLSQLKPRRVVTLNRKIQVKLQEKWAIAEPSENFEVFASIEWDHPSIGYQEYRYVHGVTDFGDLAPARTFGFLKEVEMLRARGLARGGSYNNAVVLDEHLVLNPGGLRFSDEFVRHKVLDALGDFKLAGVDFLASFRLHRAGHDVHWQLLKSIFADPTNYEIHGDHAERESRQIKEEIRDSVLSRSAPQGA